MSTSIGPQAPTLLFVAPSKGATVLFEHEASTELDNVDDGTHGGGEEPKGRSLTVMPSMPTTRLIVLYRLLSADKQSL